MRFALLPVLFLLNQAPEEFNAIEKWSRSLQSFEGVYQLKQESENPKLNWVYLITYKFEGENKFISIDGLNPDTHGGMYKETHSLYKGILTSKVDRREGPPTGDVLLQSDSLPIPEGAFLIPEEIFGAYDGKIPLHEIFLPEHASVHVYNGNKYLSLKKFKGTRFLDIMLDDNDYPKRLEWVVRDNRDMEELREVCNCDPFGVRAVMSSIEFEDVTDFDGILFPLKVIRTQYAYASTERDKLAKTYSSGKLTPAEYTVKRFELEGRPNVIQTMTLEVVRINQPLSKNDFNIEFPVGAAVVDKRTNSVVTLTDEVVDPGLFPKILESFGAPVNTKPQPMVPDDSTPGITVYPTDGAGKVENQTPWYFQPTHPFMLGIYAAVSLFVVLVLFMQRRK